MIRIAALLFLFVCAGCLTGGAQEKYNAIDAGDFLGSSGVDKIAVKLSTRTVHYIGYKQAPRPDKPTEDVFQLTFRPEAGLLAQALDNRQPVNALGAQLALANDAKEICADYATFLVNVYGPKTVGNKTTLFRIRFEEPAQTAQITTATFYVNTHFSVVDGECGAFIPQQEIQPPSAIPPITLGSGTSITFVRHGINVFTEGDVKEMYLLLFETDTPWLDSERMAKDESFKIQAEETLRAEAAELCRDHADRIVGEILGGPIPDTFSVVGIRMRKPLTKGDVISTYTNWTSLFTVVNGRCGPPFDTDKTV